MVDCYPLAIKHGLLDNPSFTDDLHPIEFGALILGDSDSVGQLHARSSHQRQQWPLAKPTSGGLMGCLSLPCSAPMRTRCF